MELEAIKEQLSNHIPTLIDKSEERIMKYVEKSEERLKEDNQKMKEDNEKMEQRLKEFMKALIDKNPPKNSHHTPN